MILNSHADIYDCLKIGVNFQCKKPFIVAEVDIQNFVHQIVLN